MTTTVAHYQELVTSQFRYKSKFFATLSAAFTPLVQDINSLLDLQSKFDLDTAVGEQLDMIGEWVGFPRVIGTTLAGFYFSFDVSGVGIDEGVWRGPFDTDEVSVSLDDTTYRTMLRARIGANHWDGSMEDLQVILDGIFAGTGTEVFALDYQDMSMEFVLAGDLPSVTLQSLLARGYFPLKPATVRVRGYTVTSDPGSPVFAFDSDPGSTYMGGLDSGAWGVSLV